MRVVPDTRRAKRSFLADDGALLARRLRGRTRRTPPTEYLRVFTADGGAALTGGLNWYRANDFRAPDGSDHRADALRVVDR